MCCSKYGAQPSTKPFHTEQTVMYSKHSTQYTHSNTHAETHWMATGRACGECTHINNQLDMWLLLLVLVMRSERAVSAYT